MTEQSLHDVPGITVRLRGEPRQRHDGEVSRRSGIAHRRVEDGGAKEENSEHHGSEELNIISGRIPHV